MVLPDSALLALRPLILVVLVLAASAASGVPVAIGLNFTAARGSGPPDTMGAVGEEHIVHFINRQFKVFRKADAALVVDLSSEQFWRAAGLFPSDNFDPRVVYDPFVRRWYAVEAAERSSPASAYLFAVSDTSDPTAGWTAFNIDGDSTDQGWVDFPLLGFDADSVFLSANMIDDSGASFSGIRATSVVVLPKDDLLAPAPTIADATHFENIPLNELSFTPQQTLNLDGTDVPAPLVASSGLPGAAQFARIAGTAREPVLEGLGGSGFRLLDPVDGGTQKPAPQPGLAVPLDTGDANFHARLVLRNGSLWGTRMINSGGRVAAQWFEFDPSDGSVRQSGVVTDPGLNFIYPSIAVNELDQVVIGFTGVSEEEFASAYAVVGETLNGVTAFGELILLKAGESAYEVVFDDRNRWGDYSATVVDPKNPRVFWTFQEWAESEFGWGTQIAQLILVPEPATALLLASGLAGLVVRRRGLGGARSPVPTAPIGMRTWRPHVDRVAIDEARPGLGGRGTRGGGRGRLHDLRGDSIR